MCNMSIANYSLYLYIYLSVSSLSASIFLSFLLLYNNIRKIIHLQFSIVNSVINIIFWKFRVFCCAEI